MALYDLVFSAGGTKGVAFIGALEILENGKHQFARLLGSSAGAITATLVAGGYTAKELLSQAADEGTEKAILPTFLKTPPEELLLDAARRKDSETRRLFRQAVERSIDAALQKLIDSTPRLGVGLKVALGFVKGDLYDSAYEAFLDHKTGLGMFGPIISFLEFGGFYTTEGFCTWLVERLRQKIKGFNASWTLAKFHQETQRDLSVAVADTTSRQSLVLNHRTAPDCPLIQAVRMSMSIPLVWQEVAWEAGWGKYLGEVKTGHLMVDGGAMTIMPLRYVLEPDHPEVKRIMGPPPNEKPIPLALLIDEQLPVPGNIEPPKRDQSRLQERVERLIDTVLRWEDAYFQKNESVICRIPAFGFSALELNASTERLRVLLDAGRCSMIEHLKKRK